MTKLNISGKAVWVVCFFLIQTIMVVCFYSDLTRKINELKKYTDEKTGASREATYFKVLGEAIDLTFENDALTYKYKEQYISVKDVVEYLLDLHGLEIKYSEPVKTNPAIVKKEDAQGGTK